MDNKEKLMKSKKEKPKKNKQIKGKDNIWMEIAQYIGVIQLTLKVHHKDI
jgi:hypothetical protein